jgi:hypothetical protein
MQNKPNLLRGKTNATFFATKYYENNLCLVLLENKPNTNPIQTQSNPIFTKNPEKPARLV